MIAAISIRQPWAWLVTHGEIEYIPRHTKVRYRGPLIIHTGQRDDQHGWFMLLNLGFEVPRRLPHGGYVGEVCLRSCTSAARVRREHGVQYLTTRYCWRVSRAMAYTSFQPARGWPGLWKMLDQRELRMPLSNGSYRT